MYKFYFYIIMTTLDSRVGSDADGAITMQAHNLEIFDSKRKCL